MRQSATSLETRHLDAYWRDGYLFPIRVISEQDALGYRRELEDVEANWRNADLPLPLNQYQRVNAQCVMPFAARLARHPAVLNAVEGILGPDILIWSAEFFVKEPYTDHIVSMHQDLTYWGLGETSDQVTAWIALSASTAESGCMDFVRGSHKNPILPHADTFSETNLLSRGQEIAVDVQEEDKIRIELSPGEMSLHHGLTIHGSGPNKSDDRRVGFAIRYLSPNACQQIADRDYAMLARGVDVSGNFINYAPPDELFEPASLALYDKIRTDQAKALAAGAATDVGLYQ
jgi:ectoine hydroxylase-related dioxygenase (phytanoyl-CoA dioxygenase family)